MRVASVAAMVVAAVAQSYAFTAAAADMLEDAPAPPTLLYFYGGDLWHEGAFLHGGLLWSPAGLDQSGFTLKFIFGSGVYRYRSGALGDMDVTGHQWLASLMPGWRFKGPNSELTVFAGGDAQHHALSPDDPSNGIGGSHLGLRSAFDFWHQPTPTTMVALSGSVSTISTSYDARLAYGWRLFDRFYVGPETQALASDGYRQYRFGLHLTALKIKEVEISAGLGYARDSSSHQGAYGRISLLSRR